jgi:uncharacterized SAM-binding protein YcdF (DUF218 family)
MLSPEVRALAEILWHYSKVEDPLQPSDAIMVLGSYDIRLASYAAGLFHDGWAPLLIFSGGLSPFTAQVFQRPEAREFADLAITQGVPPERILMEERSTNTGENFRFTAELLREKGLAPESFLLVQKPNMLRRVRATAAKLWPQKRCLTSTHPLSFTECPVGIVNPEMYVHEIVGDIQRIKVYPGRGFQVTQEIPAAVWAAYERLVNLGYTGKLIPA